MRDTRAELLIQAETLVRGRGYAGFSYADLAEAVGIRKASIHHHFPTKVDLGAALVAAGLVDRLQAQLVRHQFQLSLRPGRPQVSLRELTALVEAIVARDADRAGSAAVAHFRSVIEALSEPTPGGPA